MLLNNQSLSPSKVWRYQISIIKCSYYNFQGFFHISQQISKISVFYYIPLSTYSITIKLTCLQQYYRSNTLLKLLFVKRKGSHSPPCWDEIANCLCNLNVMKIFIPVFHMEVNIYGTNWSSRFCFFPVLIIYRDRGAGLQKVLVKCNCMNFGWCLALNRVTRSNKNILNNFQRYHGYFQEGEMHFVIKGSYVTSF